jgi:hypothetical protein
LKRLVAISEDSRSIPGQPHTDDQSEEAWVNGGRFGNPNKLSAVTPAVVDAAR